MLPTALLAVSRSEPLVLQHAHSLLSQQVCALEAQTNIQAHQWRTAFSWTQLFSRAWPTGPENTHVCFVDPRSVLMHHKWQAEGSLDEHTEEEQANCLEVPTALLPQLAQGSLELGDMDDPLNAWYFGKKAEIFQYQMIGSHTTQSGFTSIIERSTLERIMRGEVRSIEKLPDWDTFLQQYEKARGKWPQRKLPFLFAGRMIESSLAAVYKLTEEGKVVGVCVSSEAT